MAASDFQVSVIIPVYNAGPYLREAVASALAQPETAEVLLIEDNSPDNSLEVCQQLVTEYNHVRLLRHPNGENRGAGPSRSLGVMESGCEFIAFLDADDVYLPERFSVPAQMLVADSTLDGVYEAIGAFEEGAINPDHWIRTIGDMPMLTTVKMAVPPDALFATLIGEQPVGHFSLDGLVVRRRLFDKTGLFHKMRLHQDTEMIIRMAAVGRLAPGRIDTPVTNRRIHPQNRISAPRPQKDIFEARMRLGKAVYAWSKQNLDRQKRDLAADYWVRYGMNIPRRENEFARFPEPVQVAFRLMRLPRYAPQLLRERAYYRRLWNQWHMIVYPHQRRVWLKLRYEWKRLWK